MASELIRPTTRGWVVANCLKIGPLSFTTKVALNKIFIVIFVTIIRIYPLYYSIVGTVIIITIILYSTRIVTIKGVFPIEAKSIIFLLSQVSEFPS